MPRHKWPGRSHPGLTHHTTLDISCLGGNNKENRTVHGAGVFVGQRSKNLFEEAKFFLLSAGLFRCAHVSQTRLVTERLVCSLSRDPRSSVDESCLVLNQRTPGFDPLRRVSWGRRALNQLASQRESPVRLLVG